MSSLPRRPHGLALLEFALGVAVAAVLLALALGSVSRLKLLGDEARRVSIASQQAAASATRLLQCELPRGASSAPPGCPPCAPVSPVMPPPSGTAASTPSLSHSCP